MARNLRKGRLRLVPGGVVDGKRTPYRIHDTETGKDVVSRACFHSHAAMAVSDFKAFCEEAERAFWEGRPADGQEQG